LAAREAWRDWVERTFHTGLICLEGRTRIEPQPGYPAYFCHFDILQAHANFFQGERIGTMVLDEVHMLQAPRTQRMQAVSSIAPKVDKILGLSGTPMWNRPKSLYSILHTIMPGAWGTRFQFCSRYAGPEMTAHGWTFEGVSNAEELRLRLETVMVRKTWADVAPELPPTTRIVEPVELTGAQYTSIEAVAMKVSLAKGTSTEAGYNATLRRKLGEVKIKPAVVDALRAADDGHKVVLWCWHNEVAEKLVDALRDARSARSIYRLQSSDSARVRDANVASFRADPMTCFMVANMGVGGVGLDLSCSDYAIFVELDWTPAVVEQASMRTFHLTRPHVLVFLHADCPTDAALVEALDVKNGFAAAAGLGGADILRKVLA
jgi:SNF2 family DNA or RNA helicase